MTSWIAEFAEPADRARVDAVEAVASAYGLGVVSRFLDQHEGILRRAAAGPTAVLRAWCAAPGTFHTVWDPVFERARHALQTSQPSEAEVVDVATLLALRILDTTRRDDRWQAALHQPSPVLVGAALVPGARRVVAAGDALTIETSTGASVTLERESLHDWSTTAGRPLCVHRIGAPPVRVLSSVALPDEDRTRRSRSECDALHEVDDDTAGVFARGWDLLEAAWPDAPAWVAGGIRALVASRIEEPFHLVSGSWEDMPGYVHASTPHVPVDIAEILVHEAAHQYFYLLERMGPFDDGSDEELHWSPPIRMHRPISRVLMAYHALVNVLTLYRRVRELGGPEAGYVNANEPQLREDIAQLDLALRDNGALTDVGRALYETLAARVGGAIAAVP